MSTTQNTQTMTTQEAAFYLALGITTPTETLLNPNRILERQEAIWTDPGEFRSAIQIITNHLREHPTASMTEVFGCHTPQAIQILQRHHRMEAA